MKKRYIAYTDPQGSKITVPAKNEMKAKEEASKFFGVEPCEVEVEALQESRSSLFSLLLP